MEITQRENEGVAVLDISGEIDLYNAGELRTAIQNAFAQGKQRVLLNFRDVPYIDSTGIGVILSTVPLARKKGGDIKLVAVSANVAKVFEITNLTKFLQLCADEASAVAAFGG